jgi:hypothetical protein
MNSYFNFGISTPLGHSEVQPLQQGKVEAKNASSI